MEGRGISSQDDPAETTSPSSPVTPAMHRDQTGKDRNEPVKEHSNENTSLSGHSSSPSPGDPEKTSDERVYPHATPLQNSEAATREHIHPPHTNIQSSESSNSSTLRKPERLSTPNDPHTEEPTLDQLSEDMSRPPPLNYTLRTRKTAIAVFWTLIVIDSIGVPLILYYALDRKTSLSPNAVFSISTGCLGGISIVEYALRFWRLWKKDSTCRVLGARRWYLDWFHWNFSIAWIFIMVELIVGTIPEYPPIRLLAMPVSSLNFWFAFELLAIDTFRYLSIPAPLRISSVPKGAPMRPAIYSIIEDVCAVDGSGSTEFRKRLNARYVASHYFRQMLHRLTIFWAFGTLASAIVTTALIFTLERETAYVVGWALPFVWAGVMVPPTFWYVFRCLRREYAKWPERRGSA